MRACGDNSNIAKQHAGDPLQLGNLNRECGAVLSAQERYPEAFKYFRESTAIFKSLDNKALQANSLLHQSSALWQIGRYDEAAGALDQATAIAGQPEGGNKDLIPALLVGRALLELSRGAIPEAVARAEDALKQGANQPSVVIEARSVLCLAAARSGSASKGKASCEESVQKSKEAGDPLLVSNAELAHAEALLEAGDARAAREVAQRVYDVVAPAGRNESAWRALALAGMAGRRAGDAEGAREQLSRAASMLSQLETDWGGEAMSFYLTRPDIQSLRRELDGLSTAAPRP